jgi:hypothetical protein
MNNITSEKNSQDLKFELQPWDTMIVPYELFDELSTAFKSFIKLTDEQADAIASWVILSYFVEKPEEQQLLDYLPILNISSPERQCGKSTLKDLIYELVPRPLNTENCTEAALFRLINAKMPTLLIDESENFIHRPELRTILNGGYQKTGVVHRQGGKTWEETQQFSTWCAKCITGIGTLHDTLQSRCITIRLKRKLNTDQVLRKNIVLKDDPEFFLNLKRKIIRFYLDYNNEILNKQLEMPLELDDRSQNNWEGIYKIASVIDEKCLARIKTASISLGKNALSEDSEGIQLLKDIKEICNDDPEVSAFPSGALTICLNKMEDKQWISYNRHRGIDQSQLSRLLKPYEIHPKQQKIDGRNIRGYKRDDFEDAFKRYL